MVGVRVGEEHGVETLDFGAQRLGAEVGSGIDQNVTALVADQDGGPQPVVAGIGRGANGAVAADGGHAYAGSRTQYRDFERGRRHSGFRSGRLGGLVGDLDETEPQFRERVFQKPLLIERQVALGLFQQNGHEVDAVARYAEIRLGRFLLAKMHQAELHFGLRAQGKNQESKGRGWQRELEIFRFLFGGFYVAHQLTFYNGGMGDSPLCHRIRRKLAQVR